MLTVCLGNLGTGKTLFLTIVGYYSKKKIITNYKVDFSGREVEEFDIRKFIEAEYEDCIILLDEAYVYLESRLSGSHKNRLMSYILFQSRKKNVDMYLSVQLVSTLDKRFRHMSNFYIYAESDEISYTYLVFNKDTGKVKTIKMLRRRILPFYKMYDTNEVILPDINAILQQTLSGKEKIYEAKQIRDGVMKHYPDMVITKDMVMVYMMEHNLPMFLLTPVFVVVRLQLREEGLIK